MTTLPPGTLVVARVNTGHVLFEALADTEEDAQALLLAAYATHVARFPSYWPIDPGLMSELIDDGAPTYTYLRPGQAAIDSTPVNAAPCNNCDDPATHGGRR